MNRGQMIIVTAAFCMGSTASALPPTTSDARQIMNAVDARETGDKSVSKMTMVIKDPSGRQRTRVVQSRGLDFSGGKKQLIFFESPADVRNTGLLTIDYDDGKKTDDQWLYLPSLRKSTRISSGKKSGSFMGSDLSFADMTKRSPDQYDFKLLKQSTKAGGEDCWLIESRPRTEKAKEETGYVKSHTWVSKSKLLVQQSKIWVRKGQKIKLMKFTNFKKVSGIWVAHKILARTLQNGKPLSTTILTFSGLRYNDPSVKPTDFSQRRLESGI
jgi:outer membrane lipoprotein-sorting protein